MSHARTLLERLDEELRESEAIRADAELAIATSREARLSPTRIPGLVPAGHFFAEIARTLEENQMQ